MLRVSQTEVVKWIAVYGTVGTADIITATAVVGPVMLCRLGCPHPRYAV